MLISLEQQTELAATSLGQSKSTEIDHSQGAAVQVAKPKHTPARARHLMNPFPRHRFAGMADFQYTEGPGKAEDLSDYPEVDGPFGKERAPLTVPPPLFSKQDEPMDYGFRQRPEPGTGCAHHRGFLTAWACQM